MERILLIIAIVVLAASGSLAAKTGLPETVIPDCLGVNIHFTGPEYKQVAQIAGGGFRYIRMDCIWGNVETAKGKYDFKAYDELLDALKKQGIRPLFILCYGNRLYDDGNAPRTDKGRAAYAAFCAAAAAHFEGEGVLWELWNEPNLSGFWHPAANVADYVKMAKAAYPAIKKADPSSVVLAPALSGWDFGFLEAAFKLGLLDCTDVVSLHPYGSAKPEDAVKYHTTVRRLIKRYTKKDVPIVSGEWGYSAVNGFTVDQQAQYLVREFLTNVICGARLSIWYDWRDDGTDPNEGEHHFGTVYHDATEKPAYHAMRALSAELAGYSYQSTISPANSGDYLCLFGKGDDYRLAAWTTKPPHKVRVLVDVPLVDVVDLMGRRTRVEVKKGEVELDLTGSVQYVEPTTPSRRWALEAAWKVSATAVWDDGKPGLEISSTSLGESAELKASSGQGVKAASCTAVAENGVPMVGARLRTKYAWNGEPSPVVSVSLTVSGTDEPLVRVVEIDPTAYPQLEVLPPPKGELAIALSQPSNGSRVAFKGKVTIGSTDGIALRALSAAANMGRNDDRVVLHFPTAQQPAPVYSFSAKLVDGGGDDVVRLPTRRYAVVETFADGRIGQDVTKHALELDGDAKVPAKVKLTYAKSPAGGPGEVCARLDYEFGDGWRFVRISPKPPIKIPGRPLYANLWIKGDSNDGMVRVRVVDSDGQTFQPDLGPIDFGDWHYLTADMTCASGGHWGGRNDGVVRHPVSWDSIFLLDNVGGRKKKGTIYLGTLMLCYD